MTPPRLLFVCNAGPDVGGGHVMRSLTLAEALSDLGAVCTFLAPPDVARVIEAFGPAMTCLPAASAAPADLISAARASQADAFVFDHYGLEAPAHRQIAQGRPALAIDDLADRPLDAALVLDSGPARRVEDYAGLLPAGARVLAGPAFAPVRPAFAALREEALARRRGPVRRLMVSMGLTDVGAISARVVEGLTPFLGELALDVVVGRRAPSLPALEAMAKADPRIALHVDAQDMARLTLEADAAVGAAGSTTWERCVLALPSILVVLADNQRAAANAMARAGAALVIEADAPDFEDRLVEDALRLLADAPLRARLSGASAEVCDGHGARRVAEAFLQLIRGCDTLAGQP